MTMREYDNTNRGAIWKNNDKLTEKHPDFKGSINVEGRDFWLSGWLRPTDASPKAPSMSFSIQPKDAKPKAAQTAAKQVATDINDEIPF